MAGAPKKTIDWDQVEKAAMAGAKGNEIAAMVGIHYSTLAKRFDKEINSDGDYANFSDFLTTKKAKGNNLIRLKQFSIAMAGDRGMCIWLGKNRLGQSDKVDNNNINFDVDPEERSKILQEKISKALEAKKKRESDE